MIEGVSCNASNITLITPEIAKWWTKIDGYIFTKTFLRMKFELEKNLTPIFFAFGYVGNVLSVYVWTRPRMRTSSGLYLAALDFANFIVLFTHMFLYLVFFEQYETMMGLAFCKMLPFVGRAAQYLSPLLTLGFTVERYISICHPYMRSTLCTQRRAGIVIACMFVGAHGLAAAQIYFVIFDPVVKGCFLREDAKGVWGTYMVYTWVTEMLIFATASLVVLALNIRVIIEMRRVSKRGRRLSQGKEKSHTTATTIMLLTVSLYLVFTTVPVSVCLALIQVYDYGPRNICPEQMLENPTWQKYFQFESARSVIIMFAISHHTINFYIYLITGQRFRLYFYMSVCLRLWSICNKNVRVDVTITKTETREKVTRTECEIGEK